MVVAGAQLRDDTASQKVASTARYDGTNLKSTSADRAAVAQVVTKSAALFFDRQFGEPGAFVGLRLRAAKGLSELVAAKTNFLNKPAVDPIQIFKKLHKTLAALIVLHSSDEKTDTTLDSCGILGDERRYFYRVPRHGRRRVRTGSDRGNH